MWYPGDIDLLINKQPDHPSCVLSFPQHHILSTETKFSFSCLSSIPVNNWPVSRASTCYCLQSWLVQLSSLNTHIPANPNEQYHLKGVLGPAFNTHVDDFHLVTFAKYTCGGQPSPSCCENRKERSLLGTV